MIKTKESIKKAAEIIRVLGHPARIEILILLQKNPNRKMTVTQIQEELSLTQPETSRHLSVLKVNSVLYCEKEGANSYYFINAEHSFIHCVANCLCKYEGKNSSRK